MCSIMRKCLNQVVPTQFVVFQQTAVSPSAELLQTLHRCHICGSDVFTDSWPVDCLSRPEVYFTDCIVS